MVVSEEKYFPATISCRVHKIHTVIKDKLASELMEIFNKTIFGPLLNVDMIFSSQLFHFLLREISDERSDVTSFEILEKKVTFIKVDFKLVISLWLTDVMV